MYVLFCPPHIKSSRAHPLKLSSSKKTIPLISVMWCGSPCSLKANMRFLESEEELYSVLRLHAYPNILLLKKKLKWHWESIRNRYQDIFAHCLHQILLLWGRNFAMPNSFESLTEYRIMEEIWTLGLINFVV